ncbi:MAG TPA: transaldolase family protein [Vicinamibacteria bacterium]|nr:transaldolase family protein [Vicinamibacteria bacterium]
MSETLSPTTSRMRLTAELGAQFWNDSCAPNELAEAVERGAVGATSNPVIVFTAVKQDPATATALIDRLVADHPEEGEEEIAWRLIEELGRRAAALLESVYRETGGARGFLSMQVNPKLYRSAARMEEHARRLAAVAPNVAIKVPATPPGIAAGSALVASGINVNATVSFTLPQALVVAEAFEAAIDRALAAGHDPRRIHPYVTLMVGRLDDHLQRVLAKESVSIDPGYLHWAGIAVFKRARRIFQERGYRSTLLAAAYRHHLHWSQLIGPGVVLSMPYAWWKQFEASDIEVRPTLDEPVEPRIVDALYARFAEFRRAYDPDGLRPDEFVHYGATIHTLNQFIAGYHDLLAVVRERMLR